MKYNKTNQPLVCMMTQSTCYKETTKMEIKGVLWHSTGANNSTLKRYVQPSDDAANREEMLELLGKNKYNNDWNHIKLKAGLNAWIGKLADGTVTTVQTMPWDYRPWGCGSGSKGSCNNGFVQFEICEDNLKDKDYFNTVYQEACELTAYLCRLYNIDPKGAVNVNGVEVPTILCHKDAYNLKLGSNHGDVLYWFKKYGKTMDNVREDVAKLIDEQVKAETETETKKEITYVDYLLLEQKLIEMEQLIEELQQEDKERCVNCGSRITDWEDVEQTEKELILTYKCKTCGLYADQHYKLVYSGTEIIK